MTGIAGVAGTVSVERPFDGFGLRSFISTLSDVVSGVRDSGEEEEENIEIFIVGSGEVWGGNVLLTVMKLGCY